MERPIKTKFDIQVPAHTLLKFWRSISCLLPYAKQINVLKHFILQSKFLQLKFI